MARVATNNVQLTYGVETGVGVPPTTGAAWHLLEPNSINRFGAEVTTVARSPISASRQRRKGRITDLDSGVEFEQDLTMSALQDFIESFCYAAAVNSEMDIPITGVDGSNDEFDCAALTATQAGKLVYSASNYASLIYARGFTNSDNNGIHVLNADPATSATAVGVTSDLVAEVSPPANARIELAGIRSLAAASDLTWTWNAGSLTATLASAADISDWSALGLTPGQFIHVGSPDGSGGVTNAFQNSTAHDMNGFARVKAISGGSVTLDKVDDALRYTDGTAPATAVDILFGKFVRNVSSTHSNYLERSFTFEMQSPNLGSGGATRYEYSKGNFANNISINLPLANKATLSVGFSGTTTDVPTGTQATGASAAREPLQTGAFNTSADIARLRFQDLDEDGIATDFKSLTITLNNNLSAEKKLGQLGAVSLNPGLLEVDIEAQIIFTDETVASAIRNNVNTTMEMIMYNSDGGLVFDVPEMTLGGGGREFPANESVLMNLSGAVHANPSSQYPYSLGVSLFPYLPVPE